MGKFCVLLCLGLPLCMRKPAEGSVAVLLAGSIYGLWYLWKRSGQKKGLFTGKGSEAVKTAVVFLEAGTALIFLSVSSADYIHRPKSWPAVLIFLLGLFLVGRRKENGYLLPGTEALQGLWEKVTLAGVVLTLSLQYKSIMWNRFFEFGRPDFGITVFIAFALLVLQCPFDGSPMAFLVLFLADRTLKMLFPKTFLMPETEPFLELGRTSRGVVSESIRMELPTTLLLWGMLFFLVFQGGEALLRRRGR